MIGVILKRTIALCKIEDCSDTVGWLTLCIPCCNTSMVGFCYFNNVAVAAMHSVRSGQADRVFVLDFDIHHGNGIQDLLYDCPVSSGLNCDAF